MDTEKHSSSTGKQFSGATSSKQQDTISSSDNMQHKSEEIKGTLMKEDQRLSNKNKTGLTGNSQQGSTALSPGLNPQNAQAVIPYVTANQQGGQRGIVTAPQRTAGYVANESSKSLACKWMLQQMEM